MGSRLENRSQASDKAADAFLGSIPLERAVGNAQIAAAVRAEGRSGDDGDAVLADQALDERHRVERRVDLEEEIERAGRRGNDAEVAERFEGLEHGFAYVDDRAELVTAV